MSEKERKTLSDADSIKSLEQQAANTKYLVDRLNKAMYGMTWDEHERLHGQNHEEERQEK